MNQITINNVQTTKNIATHVLCTFLIWSNLYRTPTYHHKSMSSTLCMNKMVTCTCKQICRNEYVRRTNQHLQEYDFAGTFASTETVSRIEFCNEQVPSPANSTTCSNNVWER